MSKRNMPDTQDKFDEAMLAYTTGDLETAIAAFEDILSAQPDHFDAHLGLGLAWSRRGEHDRAIAEGHCAEKLRPRDQLVHTNLSLFYMKAGNKPAAEHHALQARIASWKTAPAPNTDTPTAQAPLAIAKPKAAGFAVSGPATAPAWKNQPTIVPPQPPTPHHDT